MLHDVLHLLALVDKPVAADGEPLDDLGALRHLDAQGGVYKILGSLEACGHTHDLTVGDVVAAVDIVVDTFRGHDHVERVERNIGTAGAARRDDQIRCVVVDHLHGTNGSIDFDNDANLFHLSMIFVSLCACNIVGGGRNAVQSYKKKVLSPLLTPAF